MSNGNQKQVVFLDAETMDLPSLDTSSLDDLQTNFGAGITLHQQTQAEDVAERIKNADAVLVQSASLYWCNCDRHEQYRP